MVKSAGDYLRRINPLAVANIAAWFFFIALLAYLSQTNYLLFHSIDEVFVAVVATAIFMITWNSRHISGNDYALFLGIAYLFIGIVTGLHMLAYKGMGVFPATDANTATQLWLVTRYLQAIAFLAAPIFLVRPLEHGKILGFFFALTTVLLASVFLGWFPDAFIEGSGLTLFKVVSEYVVIAALLGALFLLAKNKSAFEPPVYRQLALSIGCTIAAELSFTLYTDVYGFFNALGHIFHVIAFYLVYKALVHTALVEPHNLIHHKLQKLATTDPLTGLYNFRHMQELLDRELPSAQRYQKPLSLIMFDLDDFKVINDTLGHQAGDEALKAVADVIKEKVRETDFATRYGGEEFLAVLPETGSEGAKILAERTLESIAELTFKSPVLRNAKTKLTASAGIATYPTHTRDKNTLIRLADEAMYKAKEHGKNRAVITEENQ